MGEEFDEMRRTFLALLEVANELKTENNNGVQDLPARRIDWIIVRELLHFFEVGIFSTCVCVRLA